MGVLKLRRKSRALSTGAARFVALRTILEGSLLSLNSRAAIVNGLSQG
jgi:hypothetical protein